jgi:putative DNA primase/helicase
MAEDDTASVLLLADLQQLFAEKKVEKLLTESILGMLSTLDERPWPAWHKGKPLSARQMAKLLRPFGIHSKDLMTDTGTKKGYTLEDCRDAFARYLSAMPRDASSGAGSHETVSAMPRTNIAEANTRNPTSDNAPRSIADTHLGAEVPRDSVPLHAGDVCQNPTRQGCIGRLKDIGPGVQCGVCFWAPQGVPVEEEVL